MVNKENYYQEYKGHTKWLSLISLILLISDYQKPPSRPTVIQTLLFWDNNVDYRNDPKFSDRQAWANSVDPDQTAPRLFAISSASFGCFTLW